MTEDIYSINSCTIKDFNSYIIIITPSNETYKFSTLDGKYRYTFSGKFLQKYKHLYHDYKNKEDAEDILMSFEIPSLL